MNGQVVAAVSSSLVVIDLDRPARWRLPDGLETTAHAAVHTPAFSPDGTRVAFVGDLPTSGSNLRVLEVATEDPVIQLTHGAASEGLIRYLSWAPDGERIVYHRHWFGDGDYGSRLHILDHRSGEDVVVFDTADSSEHGFADWFAYGASWSPDGNKILFAGVVGEPDLRGGNGYLASTPLHVLHLDRGNAVEDLGPDNVAADGRIWVIGNARWSPDGSKLALISQDYFPRTGASYGSLGGVWLRIMDSDGSNRRTLFHLPSALSYDVGGPALGWSRDGRFIVFAITGHLVSLDTETAALERLPLSAGLFDPDCVPPGAPIPPPQRVFQPRKIAPLVRYLVRGAGAGSKIFVDPLWDPPLPTTLALAAFVLGYTVGRWQGLRVSARR